jgi:hypothetical protein
MSRYPLVATLEDLTSLPVGSIVVTEEAVAWQSLDVDVWAAYRNTPLTTGSLFEYAETLRLVFTPESGDEF